MKRTCRTIAASLLLGCILFVAGLASAEENPACNSASPDSVLAAQENASGIAIRKVNEAAADTWTYKVTNTGKVKLTNVRVTDEHFAKMSCQQDALDAGQSMACVGSEPAETVEPDSRGCAVADHVEFSEAGVTVTTMGDCVAGIN